MTALATLRKYILLVVIIVAAFILLGADGSNDAEIWTVVGIVAAGASAVFAWARSETREPAVIVGVVMAALVGVWRSVLGEEEALRFQEVLMMLAPLATAWITRAFVTPAPR